MKLIEITGKAVSGEWGTDDETGTGIPVLRTTNFTNEGIVDFNNVVTRTITKKNIADKFLRKGDIIIEKSGGSDKYPVGRVIFFEGAENKYLFNNFTGLLRVKNHENWFPKYVFYSLFANYKKGGTLPFENKTTGLHNLKTDNYVESFDVADASFTDQQHIVAVLDKISAIIASRKRQLEQLDLLVKSRFVEMFGEPIANPMGWEIKKLKDTTEIITGNTPPRSDKNNYGDFIEWIKTDNITEKTFLTTATEYLSEQGEKIARTVEKNSILMACIAGSLRSIGRVALTDRKVAFNQQINAIVPKSYNHFFLYILFQLTQSYAQSTVDMALKGILSKGKLENLEYILPPLPLQEQFAAFVAQTDKSKSAVQMSLDQTQILFDSLMQEYFG